MVKILPSLLSADFLKLGEELNKIKQTPIDMLHYDVMDGHFVPNLSFGPGILKQITDTYNYQMDVHLMLDNPLEYLEAFIKAKASIITLHIEALKSDEEVKQAIELLKKHQVKIGLSIKPNTKVDTILPYLDEIDLVLVMSVEPGFGGQVFNPKAIDKVKQLALYKKEKQFVIEVDGGINQETIKPLIENGADYLVVGSYFFKHDNYQEVYDKLI